MHQQACIPQEPVRNDPHSLSDTISAPRSRASAWAAASAAGAAAAASLAAPPSIVAATGASAAPLHSQRGRIGPGRTTPAAKLGPYAPGDAQTHSWPCCGPTALRAGRALALAAPGPRRPGASGGVPAGAGGGRGGGAPARETPDSEQSRTEQN